MTEDKNTDQDQKDFAKIFKSKYGQVLVVLDEGENGPEIEFSVKCPGYGICTLALKFQDSVEGWVKAENALISIDEAQALGVAESIVTQTHRLGLAQIE